MKKFLVMAAFVATVAANAQNTKALYDSTEVEHLQEVVVKGVRAQKNAPFAVTNIKKAELGDFSKTGQELPMLFSQSPGVARAVWASVRHTCAFAVPATHAST